VILDADYLLNKRVKAAQKEKIELRENLLRLRTEREKLALRMDEVRIKHETSSKEAQVNALPSLSSLATMFPLQENLYIPLIYSILIPTSGTGSPFHRPPRH